MLCFVCPIQCPRGYLLLRFCSSFAHKRPTLTSHIVLPYDVLLIDIKNLRQRCFDEYEFGAYRIVLLMNTKRKSGFRMIYQSYDESSKTIPKGIFIKEYSCYNYASYLFCITFFLTYIVLTVHVNSCLNYSFINHFLCHICIFKNYHFCMSILQQYFLIVNYERTVLCIYIHVSLNNKHVIKLPTPLRYLSVCSEIVLLI